MEEDISLKRRTEKAASALDRLVSRRLPSIRSGTVYVTDDCQYESRCNPSDAFFVKGKIGQDARDGSNYDSEFLQHIEKADKTCSCQSEQIDGWIAFKQRMEET